MAVLAVCACACSRCIDHERPGEPTKEWLLIEWPKGEAEPKKYWFSTLPQNITFGNLVDLTKLRWRIERDYQELKQEVGLGHFEGRGWRGFHHHATLCIAAYGFLISERETIPPSAPRSTAMFQASAIPEAYKPRGSSAASRAAHSKLDCDHAPKAHRRCGQTLAALPMLRRIRCPIFAEIPCDAVKLERFHVNRGQKPL